MDHVQGDRGHLLEERRALFQRCREIDPAMVAREVLLRQTPLKHGKWLNFIIVSICLALSAAYELFEFAMAKALGATADSFLGSQGDIWDAQWDMTFALIGAIMALVLLSKFHDRILYEKGSIG